MDGIALAKGIRERCVKARNPFFIFAFAKKGYVMILIKVFALPQ